MRETRRNNDRNPFRIHMWNFGLFFSEFEWNGTLLAMRQTVFRAIHARGSQIISNWNRGRHGLHFRAVVRRAFRCVRGEAHATRFEIRSFEREIYFSISLRVAMRVAKSYEGNIWYWSLLGVQGVAYRSNQPFFSLAKAYLLLLPPPHIIIY